MANKKAVKVVKDYMWIGKGSAPLQRLLTIYVVPTVNSQSVSGKQTILLHTLYNRPKNIF